MPMVLFPWTTVIGVLVLLLIAAVPVLRSRWVLAGVAALVLAHAVLLAPRFLPDGRQVPAHAVELRVATINTNGAPPTPRQW